MTSEISIGAVGKIMAGEDTGQFVQVLDDSINTGGYLILLSKSGRFDDTYDNWVENEEALKGYFAELNWVIEWQ